MTRKKTDAMTHTYSLQKYAGPSSRYTCPNCGGAHKFTRYVDEEGNIILAWYNALETDETARFHRPEGWDEEE